MKYLITLFTLLFLVFSCTDETASDPLELARDRLLSATSVSFEMENIWNNTFLNDTTVESHQGTYLRREQEGFPYDFVYEMEDFAIKYDQGELTKVSATKRQIITHTKEEALEDVADHSYTTKGSPFGMLQDSTWMLAEHEGKMVTYEHVAYRDSTEDGLAFTVERIHIDDDQHLLVAFERIYTLNGKPMQHIIHEYNNYRFDEDDALNFSLPKGYSTVSNADQKKMRKAEALTVGQRFPDFALEDIDGKVHDTKNLRKKKALYVFSFIGCGGCEYTRQELAKMDFELSEEYVGLYLNPLNDASQLRDYHADKPWPFPMGTIDYDFSERYGVYSYPTFITVDANGMVEEVRSGYDEEFFTSKAKK